MSRRNLYIIGAGSFAREVENWLELIPQTECDWEIAGFLDKHTPAGKLPYPSGYENLGDETTFSFSPNDYALIAIGDNRIREKIYHQLKGRVQFFTFIAPNSIIGKFNRIGEGSIICPNCIITTNVTLGKCTIMNIGAHVGHDAVLGDFCGLMPNVDIAGNCRLGERVFVGTNAAVIPGKWLASDITVGAGAVVVKDFAEEGITIMGNPAKKRERNP